jgi:hypothetical protein
MREVNMNRAGRPLTRANSIEEAYVIWGDMPFPKGCVLTDLSQTGASVRVFGDLPEVLTVLVPRLGIRIEARITWRDRGFCGVEFLSSQPVSGDR